MGRTYLLPLTQLLLLLSASLLLSGCATTSGQMPADTLAQYEFAGELSLSGELRPIRGALAMTFAMSRNNDTAGKQRAFILPRMNADEASLVGDVTILPAESLLQFAHTSLLAMQMRV